MRISSKRAFAYLVALCWATCFTLITCQAQTSSANPSDDAVMRGRIHAIFRETLDRGKSSLLYDGSLITAQTFVPPSNEHTDEILSYGKDAIPILSEYLTSNNGFEKHLAMRFLGSIGGRDVVEPLRKVAFEDRSPSFRSVALLWLTQVPWDLARPILEQAAENDCAAEVRDQAKEILARHVANN
jgi:HEAT repeats